MAEGGYPAIGAGGPADSPLPAGYGSLDDGFPQAEPDVADRRRAARNGGPPGPAAAAAGAPAHEQAPPGDRPVRPWARRTRPAPAEPPPGEPAPGPRTDALRPPPAYVPPGAAPPGLVPGPPTGPPTGPPMGDRPSRPGARYEGADIQEGPVRGTRRPHQKVQVVRGVRSRRLVRRIDVWTVFKVSFIFYLLALIVLLVAGIILWNVASSLGFLTSIEKSVRTLFSLKTFRLHPGSTLAYAGAIGAVLCLVGVLVNTIAAVTYNLISDLVGGIQVVVVSEPD